MMAYGAALSLDTLYAGRDTQVPPGAGAWTACST